MEFEVGQTVFYTADKKKGIIRFIGTVDFAAGDWIGIELPVPEGKNNGSLFGKTYFNCPDNHGLFIKKTQLIRLQGFPSRTLSSSTNTSQVSSIKRTAMSPTKISSGSTTSATMSRLQELREKRGVTSTGSISSLSSRRSPMSLHSSFRSSSLSGLSPPSSVSPQYKRETSISQVDTSSMSASQITASQASSISKPITSSNTSFVSTTREHELEEQLHQSETQIKVLQSKITELEMKLATFSNEKNETLSLVKDTSVEMEDVKTVVDSMSMEEHGKILENIHADYQNQLKELELTNAKVEELVATQRSHIDAMNAELAQYKSRITQLVESEQQKTDEIAQTVAKSSATTRKVETLEQKILSMQDSIETLNLEKETLEMDKEIAEERVEELNQNISSLTMQLKMANSRVAQQLPTSEGSSTNGVAEENQKLRAAIVALHEQTSKEKAELLKQARIAQREQTELLQLREEVEELSSANAKFKEEVEELKESLDLASAYEGMVETLTEKNLTLGEKAAEYQATIAGLESLREMEDEMEHQHLEYEAELQSEIRTQRLLVVQLKQDTSQLTTTIEDRDRTIVKFRELTQTLQQEIQSLKLQIREGSGELESLRATTHSAFNQSLSLRSLASKARSMEVDAAHQKIQRLQAQLETSFLRTAVPASLFASEDLNMLRVRLFCGRLVGKGEILVKFLRRSIQFMSEKEDETPDEEEQRNTLQIDEINGKLQQFQLGLELVRVVGITSKSLLQLESPYTSSDDYTDISVKFSQQDVQLLEDALDAGIAGYADGTLEVISTLATNPVTRLLNGINRVFPSDDESEEQRTDPVSCGILRVEALQAVNYLGFAFAYMLAFVKQQGIRLNSLESIPDQVENNQDGVTNGAQSHLKNVETQLLRLNILQKELEKRTETDLGSAEDSIYDAATNGDVMLQMFSVAKEVKDLVQLLQSMDKNENALPPTDISQMLGLQFLPKISTVESSIDTIFKIVCHGGFVDAMAPKSTNLDEGKISAGSSSLLQRAHAIHKQILEASHMQMEVKEKDAHIAKLAARLKEVEKTDATHRLVRQTLESEVLKLRDASRVLQQQKEGLEKKVQEDRQHILMTMEKQQKENSTLDSINRDLKKRIQQMEVAELNRVTSSDSKSSQNPGHNDKNLYTASNNHLVPVLKLLQSELHQVKCTLAKERMDSLLGKSTRSISSVPLSDDSKLQGIALSLKEVSKFSEQVGKRRKLPVLLDLKNTPLRQTVVEKKKVRSWNEFIFSRQLENNKIQSEFESLKLSISQRLKDEKQWPEHMIEALQHGERIFDKYSWENRNTKTPECEVPIKATKPLGRVTFGKQSASHVVQKIFMTEREHQLMVQTLLC